jgi:hypothetical protein
VKGTRHSEEQIIAILKQGEAGLTCPPSIDQTLLKVSGFYTLFNFLQSVSYAGHHLPVPGPSVGLATTRQPSVSFLYDTQTKIVFVLHSCDLYCF